MMKPTLAHTPALTASHTPVSATDTAGTHSHFSHMLKHNPTPKHSPAQSGQGPPLGDPGSLWIVTALGSSAPSWSRRAAPATPAPRRQHGSMSTATSRSQRCCGPKRRMYLWRAKDRLTCLDFDATGRMEASRLHAPVKSEPVCGDHSARRRYMRAFQSQAKLRFARNPTLVDFAFCVGALSTTYVCRLQGSVNCVGFCRRARGGGVRRLLCLFLKKPKTHRQSQKPTRSQTSHLPTHLASPISSPGLSVSPNGK